MKNYLVAVVIGIIIGVIDIIPMIIQKLPKRANVSAFTQYLFVSIVICFIDFPGISWWLEGPIISLGLAIPVIIIASEKDSKSKYIIGSMSVVLGFVISLLKHLFIAAI